MARENGLKKMKLPIGMTMDDQPVYSPYPDLCSFIVGGAGSWKTTAGLMPLLQAAACYPDILTLVNDCKSGELFAQCAAFQDHCNIIVECLDDMKHFGEENPRHIRLSALNSIIQVAKERPDLLFFAIQTVTRIAIPPASDGGLYKHFLEQCRAL